MYRSSLIALALTTGLATPAAADKPWQGFYIGINAGTGSAEWAGNLEYDPGTGPVDFFQGSPGRKLDGKGLLGGAQIGANWQTGTLVYGLEIDGAWTKIDADKTFAIDTDTNGVADYTWQIKTKIDALGTARGRIGIANGPVLFYATGGLAFARTSADLTVTGLPPQGFNPPQTPAIGSASQNHLGFVVGGGVEYKITHAVSLKAEYLYMDLGTVDYRLKGTAYPGTAPCAPGPVAAGCSFPHTTDSLSSTDLNMHVVRMGLNVKLN